MLPFGEDLAQSDRRFIGRSTGELRVVHCSRQPCHEFEVGPPHGHQARRRAESAGSGLNAEPTEPLTASLP